MQSIKGNGRLVLSPVGGLRAENCEAENCRIYTRFGGTYTGCLQIVNASSHVNDDYAGAKRQFNQMEGVSYKHLDVYKRQPQRVWGRPAAV